MYSNQLLGLAGTHILVQNSTEDKNKEWLIAEYIIYFSRQTRPTEHERCHSFEIETLAVVESVKRFRRYLFGKHFSIITDCSAV